jgi:uncharacterized membrane protein
MLMIHFLGLAMGIGTSFAHLFLGLASAKLDPADRVKFAIHSFALTKMGHIGLALLLISGGYLMTPYWSILGSMPLLIAKLSLFLVLAALIGIIGSNVRKAKQGDAQIHLSKIPPLGRLALLTSVAIVILAVLVFH